MPNKGEYDEFNLCGSYGKFVTSNAMKNPNFWPEVIIIELGENY